MDNIEFAKQNLGAEVILHIIVPIIGIIIGHNNDSIILGFTNDRGWTGLNDNDIILVHSPIIKSCWYVDKEDIRKL